MEENNPEKKVHWTVHTYKQAKRLVMIVIGFTILSLGIAMLVLPGPGVITIIGGLAILATEFVWAKSLLQHMKNKANDVKDYIINNNKGKK